MQRWWTIAAVIALLIVGTPSASSAQTTGGIAGKVLDSTGAVLPGATVTLTGPAMQGTQTATTDTTGSFRFRNVPPGQGYKVTVKLAGFREATLDESAGLPRPGRLSQHHDGAGGCERGGDGLGRLTTR